MRRALPWIVLAGLVITSNCGGGKTGTNGDESESSTTVSLTTTSLVTAAEARAAVAAAPTIVKLPSDLEPPLSKAAADQGFNMLADRGRLPNFSSTSMNLSKRCVFGDPDAEKKVVILGDSHASMWLPAFDLLGQQLHWAIYDLSKVSCPASDLAKQHLSQEKRVYTECVTWHQWAHQAIRELDPDVLVLTSLTRKDGAADEWRAGLEKTITESKTPRLRVMVLGDIPEMARKPPDCVAAHMNDVRTCSSAQTDVVDRTYHASEEAAASDTQSTYVDVIPWLCTETCTTIIGKTLVYSNTQHITATFARYMAGTLGEALARIDAPFIAADVRCGDCAYCGNFCHCRPAPSEACGWHTREAPNAGLEYDPLGFRPSR